jgi:hypothetical protein
VFTAYFLTCSLAEKLFRSFTGVIVSFNLNSTVWQEWGWRENKWHSVRNSTCHSLSESKPDKEHRKWDRKLADSFVDLLIWFGSHLFHGMGILPCWGLFQCLNKCICSYSVALPPLMLEDTVMFPTLQENLAVLSLWEGGFYGQFNRLSKVMLTRHNFCLTYLAYNLIVF